MNSPKFQLERRPDGFWRFNLIARNGQAVMRSGSFTRKENALHGIEVVKTIVAEAEIEEVGK